MTPRLRAALAAHVAASADLAAALAAEPAVDAPGELVRLSATGLPMRTLRAAGRRGELPIRRVGRADYVLRADLDAWLSTRPAGPARDTEAADDVVAEAIGRGRLRVVGSSR